MPMFWGKGGHKRRERKGTFGEKMGRNLEKDRYFGKIEGCPTENTHCLIGKGVKWERKSGEIPLE